MDADEADWFGLKICEQRGQLVRVLADLSEEEWNAPSLCEGWRVREVAAHIVMTYHWIGFRSIIDMWRTPGKRDLKGPRDFDALFDRWARRDAAKFTTSKMIQLLDRNTYRPYIRSNLAIKGSDLPHTLAFETIHGLDITIPLGKDVRPPPHTDTLRWLLASFAVPPERDTVVPYPQVDMTDVMLCATDMDWTFGTGEPLYGKGRELVALLSNRKLPVGRLDGVMRSRFTRNPS